MHVRIRVVGCDDETSAYMTLDEDSVALLEIVAGKINAESEFGCQPKMYVTVLEEEVNES